MGDIYLDNAATTFPKPDCVYEAMDHANRHLAVNAGRGSYTLGKKASQIIDHAKELVKKIANATDVAEVVFTASATIAFNEIIGGMQWKKTDMVYVSPYEHNAVMRTLHFMQTQIGFSIEELPIDSETLQIDIDKTRYVFSQKPPTHLFISHVSNVTGYILPVDRIISEAKQYEPVITVDASQALGLVPLDMRQVPIDFLVFAGHKTVYGPFGVGGFIKNSGKTLFPYIVGGTGSDSLNLDMPETGTGRYEAGSPNIIAIAGLEAALSEECNREEMLRHERKLINYVIDKVKNVKDVTIYPPEEQERTGILSLFIKGYQAADVGMILDEDYGVAVRTGYHCAPLIHKYLKDEDTLGVVRVSVSRYTTMDDVKALVEAVKEIAEG